MKWLSDMYVNIDMFSVRGYEVIHNKNGEHEKNGVGSTMTIIMFTMLGCAFYLELQKANSKDHDYLQSLIKDYGSNERNYWQMDFPITTFEIVGSGFYDVHDLEKEDYRRYIHIYASNIHNKFDEDGNL